MIDLLASRSYFLVAFLLTGVGTYMLIGNRNLIKKVIGMNVFQTGIFLFFITAAFVEGASPPLLTAPAPYVSPLPHVLILTAIVVGVSLTAVALGLIVRIYDEYGSLQESVIQERVSDGQPERVTDEHPERVTQEHPGAGDPGASGEGER